MTGQGCTLTVRDTGRGHPPGGAGPPDGGLFPGGQVPLPGPGGRGAGPDPVRQDRRPPPGAAPPGEPARPGHRRHRHPERRPPMSHRRTPLLILLACLLTAAGFSLPWVVSAWQDRQTADQVGPVRDHPPGPGRPGGPPEAGRQRLSHRGPVPGQRRLSLRVPGGGGRPGRPAGHVREGAVLFRAGGTCSPRTGGPCPAPSSFWPWGTAPCPPMTGWPPPPSGQCNCGTATPILTPTPARPWCSGSAPSTAARGNGWS